MGITTSHSSVYTAVLRACCSPHSIRGCGCYSILSMPFSICSIILFSVTAGISQTSFVRWSPFLHVLPSGQTLWLLRPTGYNRSDPVPISGESFTWPCSFCFLFFGWQPLHKKCEDADQCCFSCISLVDLLCYTNRTSEVVKFNSVNMHTHNVCTYIQIKCCLCKCHVCLPLNYNLRDKWSIICVCLGHHFHWRQ